ncbi:MAG TPA: hypothetical protein HA254_01555 [Candidatus Diapherotrites archaeon]|uniref:Translation elongation factor EF1B beta/delta subunit guanine nucleotide exchange domain-containing protein n=1 Tax=Candidatus Iainarchaeum sp. TaxID=3101447 RepID=A0A7J4IWY0_9ARCH|nr:hypothetical protein [Candidatus Diapherotrites archaeon]
MPDKTLLIIRINAKDMEKLDECVDQIKTIESGEVKDVRREPIGFGVEIIKAGILIGSKEEALPERVVNEIRALDSVEDAEIVGMTLL